MTGHRRSSLLLQATPFVLAAAVFLWASYSGARHLFPEWSTASSGAPVIKNTEARTLAREPRHDIPKIVEAHLFGKAPEQVETDVSEAPETKLQLNLLGLVASGNNQMARAIIEVGGSRMRQYGVGQDIEGTDAAIHAVEENRVLLKRGGALESLVMKRDTLSVPLQARGGAPSGSREGPERRRPQETGFGDQPDNERMTLPF